MAKIHVMLTTFVVLANGLNGVQSQLDIQNLLPLAFLKNIDLKVLGKGALQILVNAFPRVMSNTTMKHACVNDTGKLLADIVKFKMYAIQFLDAEGKLPQGVFQGGRFWVGDYQKCHSIQSDINMFTQKSFMGKYFTLALKITSGPLKPLGEIYMGLCLPDSCDQNDVKGLGEEILKLVGTKALSVHFVIEDTDITLDSAAIALIVITAIVVILVLLGTAVELLPHVMKRQTVVPSDVKENGVVSKGIKEDTNNRRDNTKEKNIHDFQKSNKLKEFLLCFSFTNNTKKLLSTRTAKGPLACLNGMRVISMWWVIQGHVYLFSQTNSNNVVYARTVIQRFTFQPILNGAYSVDTFFFLSGLLVAYLTMKEFSEKGKMNWIYYFCHRYWRLTPLYGYLILALIVLGFWFPGGPFQWMSTSPHGPLYPMHHGCRTYWWSNLIYINNFYPHYGSGELCFGWSWYLANDMQFYIFLCPIIILLYMYRKLAGVIGGVFLIIACVVIRAVLVSYYDIIGPGDAPTRHTEDPWGQNGVMYTRPWARMSVYVVGILTGFLLQHKRCRIKMNKLTVFVGWCMATGSALAVIYGLFSYHHNGTKMSSVATGFYKSLNRTVWSLSLSWVAIACASGYGGPVNFVLSWKLWAPLGRLTFAAYLIHPITIYFYQLTLMTPIHFTDLSLIYLFVANLVFSYLIAYVVSMLVEAPMMGLEKLLLPKPKMKEKSYEVTSVNVTANESKM